MLTCCWPVFDLLVLIYWCWSVYDGLLTLVCWQWHVDVDLLTMMVDVKMLTLTCLLMTSWQWLDPLSLTCWQWPVDVDLLALICFQWPVNVDMLSTGCDAEYLHYHDLISNTAGNFIIPVFVWPSQLSSDTVSGMGFWTLVFMEWNIPVMLADGEELRGGEDE